MARETFQQEGTNQMNIRAAVPVSRQIDANDSAIIEHARNGMQRRISATQTVGEVTKIGVQPHPEAPDAIDLHIFEAEVA